jgi:hypothetical protein
MVRKRRNRKTPRELIALESTPIPRFEFLERAEEFLQAYLDLPQRRSSLFNWPRCVMLGHATELALKAYLLTPAAAASALTLDQLRQAPYGHDLVELLNAAVNRGLEPDAQMAKDIALLSRCHSNLQARYPLVIIPAQGSMPEGPWVAAVEGLYPTVLKLFERIRLRVRPALD